MDLGRIPVQPVGDHFPREDRSSFTHEDKEARLKGIFSVVLVAQHTATDPHHHRTMPPNQGFKGSFFPPLDEEGQEFSASSRSSAWLVFRGHFTVLPGEWGDTSIGR
jgi:hypothetical protein